MAAGDFTFDTNDQPIREGNHFVMWGTCEMDDTPRAFDILPNSYLIGVLFVDEDGVGVPTCKINMASDGTTADSGSFYAYCNANSTQTVRFRAAYV